MPSLAEIDLIQIIKHTGWLAYPLILFSISAIYIVIERGVALRSEAIIPAELAESILQNTPNIGLKYSVLGRIIDFAERHTTDPEATKAYARLEVVKMERGVRYLDMIYTGAPLIGLIGTVLGLLNAFNANRDPATGLPDPAKFTESVGLALSATLCGLFVALIAMLGNGFIQRRIDGYAARLDVLLERVLARVQAKAAAHAAAESAATQVPPVLR